MAASMLNILSPKSLLNASYTCRFLPRILINNRTAHTQSSSDDIYEDDSLTEDSVNEIRNFSNLSPRLRSKAHGKVPDADYLHRKTFKDFRERKNYLKKLYAKYGKDSGVDPRICWPSKEELLVLKEDEKEWEPTLQQMIANLKEEKEREAHFRKNVQETVEKNMAKMDSLIEQFGKKALKEKEREQEAEERRRVLLDEAEEYYGYPVYSGSAEFKAFMKERREAEQREKRELKKNRKKAMMGAKLQAVIKND